jgi:hypothetical protein
MARIGGVITTLLPTSSGGGGGGGNSVTIDAQGAESLSSGAQIVDDTLTITAALTNPALIVVCTNENGTSVTSPTAAWDTLGSNQSMTLLVNQDAGSGRQVFIFGLRNPASGNKRLIISGLTGASVRSKSVSFSHVNPASDAAAFPNFTGASSGATPISITITTGTNNYCIAGYSSVANFSSVSDSQFFINNGGAVFAVAANYKITTGATDTLTGSPGSASSTVAGGTIAHD